MNVPIATPDPGSTRDREFTLLFVVMLVLGAGNTALQSVMPAIGRSLAIADSVIALAFSVSALVWVIAAPIWANRSNRTGRRSPRSLRSSPRG